MTWTELDWNSLNKHRERFLGGRPSDGPYWESATDLASYDLTFAERIGWKWDAVLDELKMRGWAPPAGMVLDWGCGSGVASRRVIERYGPNQFSSLMLWDHSEVATAYAQESATRLFPGLAASIATDAFMNGTDEIGLLVISHVLNELPHQALEDLKALVSRSRAVLWTEPGSRDTSRALGKFRDELTGEFRVIAPCTHANPCPILQPGNERHWCHFFAAPPSLIFADSNWVKFGQRAGIDLRSLPYSFIALERGGKASPEGLSRVIGRPEQFKPYLRLLNCDATGLSEIEIMRRHDPALYKDLPKTKAPLVYKWVRRDAAVVGGTRPDPGSSG